MMIGVALCHLLLAAASYLTLQVDAQLMNRDERYILVAEDQGLPSATQVASLTLPSATMCALKCMERGDQCDAFQYNPQQQQCQLHHQLSSPSAARTMMQGYRLFRSPKVEVTVPLVTISASQETTVGAQTSTKEATPAPATSIGVPANTQTVTQTDTQPVATSAPDTTIGAQTNTQPAAIPTSSLDTTLAPIVTTTTQVPSSPCSPPTISSNLYSHVCGGTTHTITAGLRLKNGQWLVFTSNDKYFHCNSLSTIDAQHLSQCTLLAANSDIPTGLTAGSSIIDPSGQTTDSFYLLTSTHVFCFTPSAYPTYIKPCTQWVSKTIQEEFGNGVPSNIDAAAGSWQSDKKIFFFKGNQVYEYTQGQAAVPSFPLRGDSSKWWSNLPCDVTGILTGQNQNEFVVFKNQDHFSYNGATLHHKGKNCK